MRNFARFEQFQTILHFFYSIVETFGVLFSLYTKAIIQHEATQDRYTDYQQRFTSS